MHIMALIIVKWFAVLVVLLIPGKALYKNKYLLTGLQASVQNLLTLCSFSTAACQEAKLLDCGMLLLLAYAHSASSCMSSHH